MWFSISVQQDADSVVPQADGRSESTKDPEEARVLGSQGAGGASGGFMMYMVCIGSLRHILLTVLLEHGHRHSCEASKASRPKGQPSVTLVCGRQQVDIPSARFLCCVSRPPQNSNACEDDPHGSCLTKGQHKWGSGNDRCLSLRTERLSVSA